MKMHLVQEVKYFYPTNQTERLQCTDNNYEQTTLTWKCIFLVLYIVCVAFTCICMENYSQFCTAAVYKITTKKHSFSYIHCVCVCVHGRHISNIPLSFSMCYSVYLLYMHKMCVVKERNNNNNRIMYKKLFRSNMM